MFDELAVLARQHQLIFTVYVDDITFSGQKIPKGFQNEVWKIVYRHGHQLNRKKSRLYLAEQAKEITGVILYQGKLKLTHRTYQKLHEKLTEWKEIAQSGNVDLVYKNYVYNSLIGLLFYISQFTDKYKKLLNLLQQKQN